MTITFTTYGTPRPAGSKRGFLNKHSGRICMVDASGDKGRMWRQDVARAALEAMHEQADCELLDGPLELVLTLHMPRPKHHYRSGGRILKDTAPKWHTNKPDSTKLLRAVEDAMTGIVWNDDSQVARQHVEKVYCEERQLCGCSVVVRQIEEQAGGVLQPLTTKQD